MTFPTSTLSKFGVPLASGQQVGILQPKPKYRFQVIATNFGSAVNQYNLTRQLITIGKPKVNWNPQEVHSYNSIAYYAGKHEWQTIDMTVRDDVTNNVSMLVGYQIQKQMNMFEQTEFAAGINYKFQLGINILDGGNENILEQWSIEGCFLSAVNYSELDYANSEPQDITMTIRYDNAVYFGQSGTEVLMPDPAFPSVGPVNASVNPAIG